MLYKATTSFSGIFSMMAGEVKEITDKALISDLLKAGYIIEFTADKKSAKKKKGEK